MIDMFSLKVLALIICKDNMRVKENLLIELIQDDEGQKLQSGLQRYIDADNPRLKRAIKKMFFFIEIMPKKYYEEL